MAPIQRCSSDEAEGGLELRTVRATPAPVCSRYRRHRDLARAYHENFDTMAAAPTFEKRNRQLAHHRAGDAGYLGQ
jgi:hypothetical protein